MSDATSLVEQPTGEVTAAGEPPDGSVRGVAPLAQPVPPLPAGPGTAGGQNAAHVALVLMAIVVMVGVITYLGPILKPFLVAVFLYFSTKAAAGFLIRRGFPALLAYLTLFVAGSALVAGLGLLAYGEAEAFRAEWPRYQQRILTVIGRAPGEAREPLAGLFTTWSREVFQYLFERGLGLVELLTMTFFYLLFILLGAGRLPQRMRRAFPGGRGEHLVALGKKIGVGMERFMQVKTLVSIGMGATAAAI